MIHPDYNPDGSYSVRYQKAEWKREQIDQLSTELFQQLTSRELCNDIFDSLSMVEREQILAALKSFDYAEVGSVLIGAVFDYCREQAKNELK